MTTTVRKYQRFSWIYDRIKQQQFADILDAEFVADYAEATKAPFIPAPWGAGWCKQLSRDLLEMTRMGVLTRSRMGLPSGNWQPGFPKWVWSYQLGGDR